MSRALIALLLTAGCSEYGIFKEPDRERPTEDDTGDDIVLDDTDEPGEDTGDTGFDEPVVEEDDLIDCSDVGLWVDQWWGSMPFQAEHPPTDQSGNPYWAWSHDLKDWSTVSNPDIGHVPSQYDKVYRVKLWLDAVGPRIFLDVQSDDGVWIHLNEDQVGHWGGDWQEEGCVNDDANCTEYVDADPVEITDRVQVGENILAIRLSNAIDGSYMGVMPRCLDE